MEQLVAAAAGLAADFREKLESPIHASQSEVASAMLTRSAYLRAEFAARVRGATTLHTPAQQDEINLAMCRAEALHQAATLVLWCLQQQQNHGGEQLTLHVTARDFANRQGDARRILAELEDRRVKQDPWWQTWLSSGGERQARREDAPPVLLFQHLVAGETGIALAAPEDAAKATYELLLGHLAAGSVVDAQAELWRATATGFYVVCDDLFDRLMRARGGGRGDAAAAAAAAIEALAEVGRRAKDLETMWNLGARSLNFVFAHWLLDCSVRFFVGESGGADDDGRAACHALQGK